MHVRYGLLAVLLLGPGYGQQLAREFERRSGAPVNAGQVSATLERLARDGLVVDLGGEHGDPSAGRRRIGITLEGRDAVETWAESGEDEDSGAVLPLLAAVDGGLALGYASARRARLRDQADAPQPPDGDDAESWRIAVQHDRARAVAEAELRWLEGVLAALEQEPSRYELPLGVQPRRGRPQRAV